MNKTIRKLTIAVVALALILLGVVGGVAAWLVAETGPVTNTFTVGKIEIELDESTSVYKVVPGGYDAKDPTVTVKLGSEKCYVYVLIENELVIGSTTVATPNIDASKWIQVGAQGNKVLYRYVDKVDAAAAAQVLPFFTQVDYADTEITLGNIDTLKGKTIKLKAYAHQSEHIGGVAVADAAIAGLASVTLISTP